MGNVLGAAKVLPGAQRCDTDDAPLLFVGEYAIYSSIPKYISILLLKASHREMLEWWNGGRGWGAYLHVLQHNPDVGLLLRGQVRGEVFDGFRDAEPRLRFFCCELHDRHPFLDILQNDSEESAGSKANVSKSLPFPLVLVPTAKEAMTYTLRTGYSRIVEDDGPRWVTLDTG